MPFQPTGWLAWQYFLHFCRVFLPLPSSVREPIVCSWLGLEDTVPPVTGQADDAWITAWTRFKWTTQLCTRSQKMCLCLAPTEFLAFPQKLQAAHYKEDREINKRELDPEVISVLQQLLLSSPILCHSMRSCLAETLVLTFWFYFGSPTAEMHPLLL